MGPTLDLRRAMAYLAVVTVLTVIHGFALGWQLPLDLAVYERGGADSLSGADDLYGPRPGQLPFTYPPLAALLFAPLHALPAPVTMLVVAWLSYASLAVLVMIGLLMAPGIDPRLGPVATVAAALLEPVAETLRFGQVNLVLAALVAVDLLLIPRRWRGLLLAVAISIKLTPGIFLLVPLARRDWRTLVRAMSATVALSAAPMLFLPHSWYDFWFRAIRDPQRVGGVEYLSNQSISGAAWRLMGEGGVPLVVLAMQLGVVGIAAFAMLRARSRDPLASVLIAAVAGLLVSPISWIHHWVWITLLAPWFVLEGLRPGRSPRWLRTAMLSTALAWLLVTATRLVWLAPDGHHLEYSAGTALISRSGNGSGCAMKPQCHVPITHALVGFVQT